MPSTDETWMQAALALAEEAKKQNEVPVGAIVVKDGHIIGRGFNRRETTQTTLSHAELIAIDAACRHLNSWRLTGCEIYVTLEPCLMCAGAIYQARCDRVVYGTKDPKAGALGSLYKIHEDSRLNHTFDVASGVLQQECAAILSEFFRQKR